MSGITDVQMKRVKRERLEEGQRSPSARLDRDDDRARAASVSTNVEEEFTSDEEEPEEFEPEATMAAFEAHAQRKSKYAGVSHVPV